MGISCIYLRITLLLFFLESVFGVVYSHVQVILPQTIRISVVVSPVTRVTSIERFYFPLFVDFFKARLSLHPPKKKKKKREKKGECLESLSQDAWGRVGGGGEERGFSYIYLRLRCHICSLGF